VHHPQHFDQVAILTILRFVVLVSERDLARKVFNSSAYVKPCIVPVAEAIIGSAAWVFLDGKHHVDFRKGLNGLFTRKALQCYLPTQEKVWSEYYARFTAVSKENEGKPMPFMGHFREINCALSCRTFVGNYISDQAVKKIADDYYCITAALELVNIPLSMYVPYTKVWLGKRAADGVLAEFSKCAAASRLNMAAGRAPACVIDRWIESMIESQTYRDKISAGEADPHKPTVLLREFTDFEIAQTMFTFLFASQDASSSATTWLFQIMAQRPDVLDRVRQENLDARGGKREGALDLEMLESMTYTNAVVKEVLRYRPPVIFVPYSVKKSFPITPTYTVPEGAMVVPSCYPALHDPEVYPQPDMFDPERWISGDAAEKSKNWLVFGTGPHNCIAQQYVQLTMTAMIGKAALELDWVHHATSRSEEIKVFATLFPMVSQSSPSLKARS
jgi:C-22 sterol desaturase